MHYALRIMLAAGIGGEPAFGYTATLLEDFQDAPEAGKGEHGQQGLSLIHI